MSVKYIIIDDMVWCIDNGNITRENRTKFQVYEVLNQMRRNHQIVELEHYERGKRLFVMNPNSEVVWTRYFAYLAHPYSGNEMDAINEANEWGKMCLAKHLAFFSPIAHTNTLENCASAQTFRDLDIQTLNQFLQGPRELILLFKETWETSKGCRMEYDWAYHNNVKCYKLEPALYENLLIEI